MVKSISFIQVSLWHPLMSKLLVQSPNRLQFEYFRKLLVLTSVTKSHSKSRVFKLEEMPLLAAETLLE